jgi:hypothetical protein
MHVNTNFQRWLAFLVPAGLVTILGLGFESLLLAHGIPRLMILAGSNAATGAICGILYLCSRLRAGERQQELEERLRKIAEMNHHVRNALAVVQFYGAQRGDRYATEAVSQAVERIEWTLREVLPRGWALEKSVVLNMNKSSRAASASQVN